MKEEEKRNGLVSFLLALIQPHEYSQILFFMRIHIVAFKSEFLVPLPVDSFTLATQDMYSFHFMSLLICLYLYVSVCV